MVTSVVLLQLASLTCVFGLPAIGVIGDVESAVVVRSKRDPSRSMTFSGFLPGSGMSAFASSADYNPYRPRRPSHPQLPASGEDYPPEPAAAEQPPQQNPAQEPAEEEEEEESQPQPPRRVNKKKKKYSPKEEEEEEEEDRPARGNGGNAAASFNAWFPIMLGMYPPGGYPEEGFSRGGQGGRYPSHSAPASHTTVIANSVSHGRSGVASSHAVAYGGGGGGHQQGSARIR